VPGSIPSLTRSRGILFRCSAIVRRRSYMTVGGSEYRTPAQRADRYAYPRPRSGDLTTRIRGGASSSTAATSIRQPSRRKAARPRRPRRRPLSPSWPGVAMYRSRHPHPVLSCRRIRRCLAAATTTRGLPALGRVELPASRLQARQQEPPCATVTRRYHHAPDALPAPAGPAASSRPR
jgi:hypothetical protein